MYYLSLIAKSINPVVNFRVNSLVKNNLLINFLFITLSIDKLIVGWGDDRNPNNVYIIINLLGFVPHPNLRHKETSIRCILAGYEAGTL